MLLARHALMSFTTLPNRGRTVDTASVFLAHPLKFSAVYTENTLKYSLVLLAKKPQVRPLISLADHSLTCETSMNFIKCVTGWSRYIKMIRMHSILNIIYLDNIELTLLEKRWWCRNITPEGNIPHLMVDVHVTSTRLITNRCWTRAWVVSKKPTYEIVV